MSQNQSSYLSQLQALIDTYFNMDEIQEICLILSIDYEHLEGPAKPAKIRSLLLYMARCGELEQLLTILRKKRPKVTWPDVPEDAELRASVSTMEKKSPGTASGDISIGEDVIEPLRLRRTALINFLLFVVIGVILVLSRERLQIVDRIPPLEFSIGLVMLIFSALHVLMHYVRPRAMVERGDLSISGPKSSGGFLSGLMDVIHPPKITSLIMWTSVVVIMVMVGVGWAFENWPVPEAATWKSLRGSWNFGDDIFFGKGQIGFNKAYLSGPNIDDLTYEVTLRKSSNNDGPIGTMIRYDEVDDTGYLFLIWPHGAYQFSALQGGERRPLGGEDKVVGIVKQENEWNKVKMTAVGSRITVYLNEIEVISLSDDTFPSGKVGLVVHGSTRDTAEFMYPLLTKR